jgi:preprotein translocase subunit SecA
MQFHHDASNNLSQDDVMVAESDTNVVSLADASKALKVGRNEPCPCGSGKKYKQCHGSLV